MAPFLKKLLLASISLSLLGVEPPAAAANPIGDFFKKVGRSVAKWRNSPSPEPRPPKPARRSDGTADEKAAAEPSPVALTKVAPSPTPVPIDIRPAALAPKSDTRRDLPYALTVPNKPGFVTSPYAPDQGLVDVRAFPSSTEVLDPFTGKIFLTP